MAPKCVRDGFSRGVNFFPNKCAKANISAKFEDSIHDVNIWLIFDNNSSDYLG